MHEAENGVFGERRDFGSAREKLGTRNETSMQFMIMGITSVFNYLFVQQINLAGLACVADTERPSSGYFSLL